MIVRRQEKLVVMNQMELERLQKKLELLALERKEFVRLLLE